MKIKLLSVLALVAVLPSCMPPTQEMGPPPGYGGPAYHDDDPRFHGDDLGFDPRFNGGDPGYNPGFQGRGYRGGYRQIGDPTQNIYGNGPQSYARWGPRPIIRYNGNF